MAYTENQSSRVQLRSKLGVIRDKKQEGLRTLYVVTKSPIRIQRPAREAESYYEGAHDEKVGGLCGPEKYATSWSVKYAKIEENNRNLYCAHRQGVEDFENEEHYSSFVDVSNLIGI